MFDASFLPSDVYEGNPKNKETDNSPHSADDGNKFLSSLL